ncbi:MAG: class I SAM-dependent methyltransferase [Cyclobacteriaceae bacterium]
MDKKLQQHSLGYYTVVDKPSEEELQNYYTTKYYQDEKGSYSEIYSTEELHFFRNKIEQKYHLINKSLKSMEEEGKTFLDIGSGEGFALQYFKENGWDVMGLDYSNFGCRNINPDVLPHLKVGKISDSLDELIRQNAKFKVLWLINVLEHVLDPIHLMTQCRQLLEDDGILAVEVPNDFSSIQQELLRTGRTDDSYWIVVPDHISYFSVESLVNLMESTGWKEHDIITSYPIDFALFNDDTNYVQDRTKGKKVHFSRVILENHLHKISIDKTNDLYRAFANLGLGRDINGFFTKA